MSVVNRTGLGRTTLLHAAEHAAKAAAAEAARAEELREEVLSSHATPSAAFQTCLAILVVDLALLGVGENLVGM
jgi:ATPase subunit of ABC transporter with duplicated ATPase domains